jgi:hypothetical protein
MDDRKLSIFTSSNDQKYTLKKTKRLDVLNNDLNILIHLYLNFYRRLLISIKSVKTRSDQLKKISSNKHSWL